MKRLLLPLLLLILLLASFLAGRKSVRQKPVDVPRIDSLIMESQWLQSQVKEQQFIMNAVVAQKDSAIMILTVDKNHYRSRARDHEAAAQFWIQRFQEAKDQGDPCVATDHYETLIADHQQYVYNTSRQMDAADSIIDAQFAIIQEQQGMIAKQKAELANSALLIDQYRKYTGELIEAAKTSQKKEKRKRFWSGVKIILGIGAGVAAGSL